jgi:hypothetical protein
MARYIARNAWTLIFQTRKKLAGKLVEKQHDPTICAFCNLDDGLPLNKISDFPVCSACEIKVHNRTFPTWVKAFFGGVLLIVVFSFFWNWKYYQAYSAINQSTHYLNEGNLQKAFAFMSDASKKVPEVDDLNTMAEYLHGLSLLTDDKSAEALEAFNKCKDNLPPGLQHQFPHP